MQGGSRAHPLGGIVHGKGVHIEMVVNDDVEAVCGKEADEVDEARVHISVREHLIAVARPLRVARRLQRAVKCSQSSFLRSDAFPSVIGAGGSVMYVSTDTCPWKPHTHHHLPLCNQHAT